MPVVISPKFPSEDIYLDVKSLFSGCEPSIQRAMAPNYSFGNSREFIMWEVATAIFLSDESCGIAQVIASLGRILNLVIPPQFQTCCLQMFDALYSAECCHTRSTPGKSPFVIIRSGQLDRKMPNLQPRPPELPASELRDVR